MPVIPSFASALVSRRRPFSSLSPPTSYNLAFDGNSRVSNLGGTYLYPPSVISGTDGDWADPATWQGVVDADYQLFWNEQAPAAAAPQEGVGGVVYGCPVGGMTNQQCWDTYGRAYGGELMPGGAATLTGLTGGKALAI